VLAGLPSTDLDVTDITSADTGDPTLEPAQKDLPLAESDPYEFLFDPARPEPEHRDAEPEQPEPPGSDEPEAVAGWVRDHLKFLAAAAAALFAVIGLGVAVPLFGDDDRPVQSLADSQMLVAAGNSFEHLGIYQVDASNPSEKPAPLTGDGDSRLPVLSPDRRTMIYLRQLDDGSRQLRTASAIDGTGDRPLLVPKPQCSNNVSRPAWIPDTEDLVLRCVGEDDVVRLVRIGLNGNLVGVLLVVGSGEPSGLVNLGDPTVSRDGNTVVFWGQKSVQTDKDGGSLYQLNLDSPSGTLVPLLEQDTRHTFDYSDAVFSQQTGGEEQLAWRAGNRTGRGPINFEVYAASFDGKDLGTPVRISDPDTSSREQDPTFSPDGKSIVYGRQDYVAAGDDKLQDAQALWIASVKTPEDRSQLSPEDLQFWAVPAWSGR
jgi:hypothetical protein